MPLLWAPPSPVQKQLEKGYDVLRLELTAAYKTVDGSAGERKCSTILGDAAKLIKPEEVFAEGAQPGTFGVAVPCYFDTKANGEPLLSLDRGTVEFWVKATWDPQEPEETWRDNPSRVFFYYGPLRPDNPQHSNLHCLIINQDRRHDKLCLRVVNADYKSRGVDAEIKGWAKGSWHHVAAVWDMTATDKARLALYVDGKRASGPVTNWGTPDDSPIAVSAGNYAAQLGAMNSGELPAETVIQELRVSTTPSRDADFEPKHVTEKDTVGGSLFFSFNKTMEGTYTLKDAKGTLKANVGFLMRR